MSIKSAPTPDVLVRPNDDLVGIECKDIIVAFEVLSPSTENIDLRWKRRACSSLETLEHYVVIAQDALEIVCFYRARKFRERKLKGAASKLDLPALALSLPFSGIYRDTGLL